MRKPIALLAVLVASTLPLLAASLAGVTLPDTTEVGGKTLALNGIGVRTKMMFKVYVAGLYLEQKSADAPAIIKADAPKRIIMHFVRALDRDQIVEAYTEAFEGNAPDAQKTMKADIDTLLAAFEPIDEGDQWTFTYEPGTGTSLVIKGKTKVTIPGLAFGKAMFSCWLGPKPPTADLKAKLLGK